MRLLLDKLYGIVKAINIKQFIKFSVVGLINTAIFYATYYILLQFGFFYVVAITVGTLVGIINSYIWNKIYTFSTKKKSLRELCKFLLVYAVQYASNLFIVFICITFVEISPELAGLFAIGIGVFISYFGHKFWTFR